MNEIPYLLLIIFSAFTMNLTLQCALGIRGASESKTYKQTSTMIKLGIMFILIIILWVLFSRVLSSLFSGIFVYVLLFPVSYIVYEGFEYLIYKQIIKKGIDEESFISFPGGITAVAVFVCLNLANDFLEAILLSFGFTAGILLVCFIIREIRRRAALEAVPNYLRGKPLVVITLGLLSLIFSAGSLMLLRMISVR